MLKKLFSKKAKIPTAPVPRSVDDIKKAYAELRARLGEASYLQEVYALDAKHLVEALREVNAEMNARQALDEAVAKEAAAKAAPPAQPVQ